MNPLLTKAQVAEYLNVSTSTVDRETAAGRLPYVRISSRRRYREADVLYYVASRSFNRSNPHSDALREAR